MNGSHLTWKDQQSAETPSAIHAIKEIVDINRGRDQPSEAIENVKVTAIEEHSHVVSDSLQKLSIHQLDVISIEDGELQKEPDRLVEKCVAVRIDTSTEEEKAVGPPAV